MANYRLSKKGEADLLEIADCGDEYFLIGQSDRYRDQLKQRLTVLVQHPYLYQAINDIREGYLRSVVKKKKGTLSASTKRR